MKYTAAITDTLTGETRRYADEWPGSVERLGFHWSEGDSACDCDRSSDFAFAGGTSMDVDVSPLEPRCNVGPNRFRVPELRLEDGTVIPVDWRG